MKWFKHFSKARYDVKVMRLIKKYGLKGYGLYFAIVEIIAFNLETDKPVPDLEENAKDMADFFGEDTVEIEKIIKDCIELGLFEYSKNSGRVSCLKLLTHLDNTMSSNPEIKNILANFKKLQETFSKPKELKPDKIRLDKIKEDKNNMIYVNILNYWNNQEIIQHRNLTESIKKAFIKTLKIYSIEQIKQAIGNFAAILNDTNYFYKYPWGLDTFLNRKQGMPLFLDTGEKWIAYLDWGKKVATPQKTPKQIESDRKTEQKSKETDKWFEERKKKLNQIQNEKGKTNE